MPKLVKIFTATLELKGKKEDIEHIIKLIKNFAVHDRKVDCEVSPVAYFGECYEAEKFWEAEKEVPME